MSWLKLYFQSKPLTLSMLAWYFFMNLLSSAEFFQDYFFKNFQQYISVSNGLDPDRDRHFVGPDLGPNCLQKTTKVAS